MIVLTVCKIGDSLGVLLPPELVEKLGVREGDHLTLVETTEGTLLKPYDPEFSRQMELAGEIMARYRNALRRLSE
jgi:putative addiction module antidote